jgi:hypothetical protein
LIVACVLLAGRLLEPLLRDCVARRVATYEAWFPLTVSRRAWVDVR